MRGSDIVLGGIYMTSNVPTVRRVIGDADSRNPRQLDDDQVQYVECEPGGSEQGPYTCTRAAFAQWAEKRIDDSLPPAA